MNGSFPKIKICGVNSLPFAKRAEDLGADYLGFIFAERSPRRVSPKIAAEMVASLRGNAKTVGVFTETSVSEIIDVVRDVRLDVAQLHSEDYGADEIQKLHGAGLEVWQLGGRDAPRLCAARGGCVGGAARQGAEAECRPDAVLLDGRTAAGSGGTGALADWRMATELADAGIRVVLAGGISAENAVAAARTGCAVLDVNSSLETSPAVKSERLLERFFAAIAHCRLPTTHHTPCNGRCGIIQRRCNWLGGMGRLQKSVPVSGTDRVRAEDNTRKC